MSEKSQCSIRLMFLADLACKQAFEGVLYSPHNGAILKGVLHLNLRSCQSLRIVL